MNKIKLIFFILATLTAMLVCALLLMKPVQPGAAIPVNTPPVPPPPSNVSDTKPPKLPQVAQVKTSETAVQPVTKKTTVETNLVVGKTVEASAVTPVVISSELKDIFAFEQSFGRNIFQERIDLNAPLLKITEYENPDQDGRFVVSWAPVLQAKSYDFEINGDLKTDLKSPYIFDNLIEGELLMRAIAKNDNGTSKWSTMEHLIIEKKKEEKKVEREVIKINLLGIIKKKESFQALIDDKLYKVGDELCGGLIKLIEIKRIVLLKNGLEYEFPLEGSAENEM
ncbi:MAG: hypothetical protein PHW04_11200 [Candidatus Wallbacteria bacterium]|nr:hypothetical protein [Candidatus Wallbacteria bacterium]